MRTIEDIRHANLEQLIVEHGGESGGVTRLAELMTHNTSAQISQWRNRSPDHKTGKPRVISSPSARKLERACGKPAGWMDVDHNADLLSPADAAFVNEVRQDLAAYDVPDHVRQTIITLLTHSPKKA